MGGHQQCYEGRKRKREEEETDEVCSVFVYVCVCVCLCVYGCLWLGRPKVEMIEFLPMCIIFLRVGMKDRKRNEREGKKRRKKMR